MLREITPIQQSSKNTRKRWFQAHSMDVFIWLVGENIVGFQLSYDKPNAEKSLSWQHGGRYSHKRVDEGPSMNSYLVDFIENKIKQHRCTLPQP